MSMKYRMLVFDWYADLHFGQTGVFIKLKRLSMVEQSALWKWPKYFIIIYSLNIKSLFCLKELVLKNFHLVAYCDP